MVDAVGSSAMHRVGVSTAIAANAAHHAGAKTPPYRVVGLFRLMLATAVVCGHAGWLTGGDNPIGRLLGARNAVLLFFVMSGFVLTEAAATYYRNRPWAFAANRARHPDQRLQQGAVLRLQPIHSVVQPALRVARR